MRCWSLTWALPLCLVASSCGDKSAVSLTVRIDQPTVLATMGALGTDLGGSFELDMDLGPEASGPTTVTLGNFALQTAAGVALANPLEATPSGASFPLVIAKGSSQKVSFTLSSKKELTADQHDALCGGPVVIVGSVMDSLKGGTDPVRSDPITATCS